MRKVAVTNCAVDKPRLVCLCGCLGAGKTTFAENLIRIGIGAVLLKEDLTEHLIYRELHSGHAGWMETQLEFYVRWAQLICTIDASPGTIVVVDHSIDVHHKVYSRLAHEFQLISDREWQALSDAYGSFRAFTDSRFTTRNIALEASSETLASRLQVRNRDPGDEFHSDFLVGQVKIFSSSFTNEGVALILGELDSACELSNNTELQERIRRFIDIGVEG